MTYQNESQNESETTSLLSPSQSSTPLHPTDGDVEAATEDARKHYKRALGAGYMFAMGVCGIVLVALGSTLDDLAENCGTTSISVREESCGITLGFVLFTPCGGMNVLRPLTSVMVDTAIHRSWFR